MKIFLAVCYVKTTYVFKRSNKLNAFDLFHCIMSPYPLLKTEIKENWSSGSCNSCPIANISSCRSAQFCCCSCLISLAVLCPAYCQWPRRRAHCIPRLQVPWWSFGLERRMVLLYRLPCAGSVQSSEKHKVKCSKQWIAADNCCGKLYSATVIGI